MMFKKISHFEKLKVYFNELGRDHKYIGDGTLTYHSTQPGGKTVYMISMQQYRFYVNKYGIGFNSEGKMSVVAKP